MKLGVSQSPTQSHTWSTITSVWGSSPTPRWPCQGERLRAGPVDAAVVTADGRGRPPRESDGGSASRGSAPQSRSGRVEVRWPGRGGCGVGGGGGAERGGRRLPGVLLRLLWSCSVKFQQSFDWRCPRFSSSTVVGHSCYVAETYSANCADDRRDSPGVALGPVLDMPVVVQRHMHSPRMSRSSTTLSWRRGCFSWS